MIQLPKSVVSCGAVAVAAGILILAAPRAAHAIAATLVQVTNGPTNPAIGQDVSKLASQNVVLTTLGTVPAYQNAPAVLRQSFPDGHLGATPFVVPAGQNLVVTTAAVSPSFSNGTVETDIGNAISGALRDTFFVPSGVTTEFQFPNGLVFLSGESVEALDGSNTGHIHFTLHGYLTAN